MWQQSPGQHWSCLMLEHPGDQVPCVNVNNTDPGSIPVEGTPLCICRCIHVYICDILMSVLPAYRIPLSIDKLYT